MRWTTRLGMIGVLGAQLAQLDGLAWAEFPGDSLLHDYELHRVQRIEILNASAKLNPDPSAKISPLEARMSDGSPVDLVMNGTFYWREIPFGSVIRRGAWDELGVEVTPVQRAVYEQKIARRAGVAVLRSGQTVLCRPDALDRPSIEATCGGEVEEFLGGGALLVDQSIAVCTGVSRSAPLCTADLYAVQSFDQGGRGIRAEQFGARQHSVLAQKDGLLYALWARGTKTGAEMQADLIGAGFDRVVKFDGGSGFFAWTMQGLQGQGFNYSGLKIAGTKLLSASD